MKVSLIVTTYNQKDVLQLVLETTLKQTRMLDEIIVADDGSSDNTAEMIKALAKTAPIPILHAWQPNEGFRLARSRNNAVALASGDYLIFLDGDCFVNRYFVEDHLSFARPNQYLVGTRVNITPKRKEYILRTRNCNISVFSWGTRKKFNAIRSPFLASLYKKATGMAGANLSAWRNDIVRINGFDEWFVGHGGEDGDLAIRLGNAGVQCRKMIHLGMVYHFAHPRNQGRGNWDEIVQRFGETAKAGTIRCELGLDSREEMKKVVT